MNIKDFHKFSQSDLSSYYAGCTVLVTGSNGFVANYLIQRLIELGSVVHGIDLDEHPHFHGYEYHSCDLSEPHRVMKCIENIYPDYGFHLAAQSSVGSSWQREWQTIQTNLQTTYNLFKALESMSHSVRLLLISSGEVYGDLKGKKATEKDRLQPINPYSSSKAMMEMPAHRFYSTNIKYIIARSFNHTGPGRPDNFFEANVAKQFACAKNAKQDSFILSVGNIDNVRDYSDVRDIVEKYLLLGCQGTVGEAYNVCSGVGIRLKKIITLMEEISGIKAHVRVDASKIRKNDIPFLVGANRIKIKNRSLNTTFSDLYESFLKEDK